MVDLVGDASLFCEMPCILIDGQDEVVVGPGWCGVEFLGSSFVGLGKFVDRICSALSSTFFSLSSWIGDHQSSVIFFV